MAWIFVISLMLMAGGAIYQAIGLGRDAVLVPPPGRLVDIGAGRRLHLQQLGSSGPTVVFDAGIAASSVSWARVQPRAAEFARTWSYDRAGLAWSDRGRRRVTAMLCAEELHRLLEAAAVPPPYVLVGHSFGTFVVRAFARQHTNLVAGLVLVDPVYSSEWLELTGRQRWRLRGGILFSRVGAVFASFGVVRACLSLLASGATGVPKSVARALGSEADRTLNRLVNEVRKLPPEVWPAVQSHWSQAKSFTSMARHLAGLQPSARELADCELPQDLPVVVITAASQSEAGRAEHSRMAERTTQGRQIFATGSGHWVHLDEPDLVVAAIKDLTRCVTSNVSRASAPARVSEDPRTS